LTQFSLSEQTTQLLLALINEDPPQEDFNKSATPSQKNPQSAHLVSVTEDCGECIISSTEPALLITSSSAQTPAMRRASASSSTLPSSTLIIKPTPTFPCDKSDSDSDESENEIESHQFLSNSTPTVTLTPQKDPFSFSRIERVSTKKSLPSSSSLNTLPITVRPLSPSRREIASTPEAAPSPTLTPVANTSIAITSSSIKRKQKELIPDVVKTNDVAASKVLRKKKKKSNDIDDIFGGLG
jgi:hypothetical protein